jgi:DNA polymerase-3 subunit alpha
MDMTIPDLTVADGSAPFVLSMPVTKCVPPVVEQLRDVLRTHPGPTEVHLRLKNNQKTTVVRLDSKLKVLPSAALHADLKQLLGPTCIAS